MPRTYAICVTCSKLSLNASLSGHQKECSCHNKRLQEYDARHIPVKEYDTVLGHMPSNHQGFAP